MKQCTKCRQQIPDDCDVCTYCGQWQMPENEAQEKEGIKTTKSCVKCKQQIPLDCEECSFCGQIQPINKEQDENVFDSDSAKKEKLKKQWKIAGIVFGAFVLFFAGVTALIAMPSPESKPSSVSYYESETENETESTTEAIIPMNKSIVEEADTATGGRVIYSFKDFWERYEEMFLAANDHSENPVSDDQIEEYIESLSDRTRYEITEGNQGETNTAVKVYTPTSDWILSNLSTTIGVEKSSGKIINVQTIISDDASKTHSAFCVSVMCNVSVSDAGTLLDSSLNEVAGNENAISTYNNIAFIYSMSGDNLLLTLYAASDEGIEKFGETKDIVYLNTDTSQNEGNTAPIEMSDDEYYNKIITLLNNTSFVDDYLPAGSCQDMTYGELIALMFESPDVSVERTGNNSCDVTVIGKYRSEPYGQYVFNGNVTITISDVEAGECSISGGYGFTDIARSFALSY